MFSSSPVKFDVNAFLQFRLGELSADPKDPYRPDYRLAMARQAEARAAILRAEEQAAAIQEAEAEARAKREAEEHAAMLKSQEEARAKLEAEEVASIQQAEEETKALIREAKARAITLAIRETAQSVVHHAVHDALEKVKAKARRDREALAVTTVVRETASLMVNTILDEAIEQVSTKTMQAEKARAQTVVRETSRLMVHQALQDAIERIASKALRQEKERVAKTVRKAASLIVDEVVDNAAELASTKINQIHAPLLLAVLNETQRLEDEALVPVNELTDVLDKTHALVTGDLACTPRDYQSLALELQNKPSKHWKALSGMMMALAVAIATLGIVLAPAAVLSLGIAATVATETVVGATALLCAAKGYGLFAKGYQQTNTSKAVRADALQTIRDQTAQPEADQRLSVFP